MEARQHLALIEVEEAGLIRPDLMHVHVVEAGIDELPDRRDVPLGVGTARDVLGHLFD